LRQGKLPFTSTDPFGRLATIRRHPGLPERGEVDVFEIGIRPAETSVVNMTSGAAVCRDVTSEAASLASFQITLPDKPPTLYDLVDPEITRRAPFFYPAETPGRSRRKMTIRSHWEGIYETTDPTKVGWYQSLPAISRKLITSAGVGKECAIIDVGGGASLLVDGLLTDGFEKLTVLDISAGALEHARSRLGDRSQLVTWIREDVTRFSPAQRFDLWHDRAVFHFLTDRSDREKYVTVLKRALIPGGHLVIGTFAPDGPPKCSGLDVVRYSAESLGETLGPTFGLVQSASESHVTPSGTEQRYLFCRFGYNPAAAR